MYGDLDAAALLRCRPVHVSIHHQQMEASSNSTPGPFDPCVHSLGSRLCVEHTMSSSLDHTFIWQTAAGHSFRALSWVVITNPCNQSYHNHSCSNVDVVEDRRK